MSTVGQVTFTGSRGANLGNMGGTARAFTMPEDGTLNHIGVWVRERAAANSNSLRGAIYTAAGAFVCQTNILGAVIPSTTVFNAVNITFPAGLALTGGQNYIMLAMSSQTNDVVEISGQNGPGGSPVFWNDPDTTIWPNFPANLSDVVVDTAATRAWDMWLDYSPAAGSSGSMAATESGADEFDAVGGVGSNGIRLTLRDTDTGALAVNLTGVIVAVRSSSNAGTTLYSSTSGTTNASGVYQLASSALGNLGDYVYVTVEKSDHSIGALFRVPIIDLNA